MTVPESGLSKPARVYKRVLLPAPEAPRRKSFSLRFISRLSPLKTETSAEPIENERLRDTALSIKASSGLSSNSLSATFTLSLKLGQSKWSRAC